MVRLPLHEPGIRPGVGHRRARPCSAASWRDTRGSDHHADDLQSALLDGRTGRRLRRLRIVAAAVGRAPRGGRGHRRGFGGAVMYAALWRLLPGPLWVRVLTLVILAAVVLAALVTWVFPAVDGIVNPQDVTVSG